MKLNNNKGSMLLGVFLIGVTIMALVMITYRITNDTTKSVKKRKENINAFNIAEAGKEFALAALRSGKQVPFPDSTVSFYEKVPFASGYYSVTCHGDATLDTITITSTGIIGDQTAILEARCLIKYNDFTVNASIDAAITTRSDATTLGNITIDGRDHDSDGKMIGTGKKAIKSCGAIKQSGNSTIGGDGVAPAKNVTDPIIEDFIGDGGYPETPEQLLGLPAGALDQFKTSKLPSLPFYGVLYYVPPNDSFNIPDLKGSEGLLIVHNNDCDAKIMNFNGLFKGLIIADQVHHINSGATIIGAVVTLSKEPGTNAFGNGNADILYSSSIIDKLNNMTISVADTEFEILSWRQIK